MKAKGADIIAFYQEWPMGDSWYHEDALIEMAENGDVTNVNPSEKYDVNEMLGYLSPSDTDDVEPIQIGTSRIKVNEDGDIVPIFRAWMKHRAVATFVVEVPRGEETEKFLAIIASHGWKVSK